MVRLFGGRGASAIVGIFMLALGSSGAGAQNLASLNVPAAVRTLDVDLAVRPLGSAVSAVRVTPAVVSSASTITASLPQSINREAAWLYHGGWPLAALADKYSAGAPLGEEANCIATAVYFEARGE